MFSIETVPGAQKITFYIHWRYQKYSCNIKEYSSKKTRVVRHVKMKILMGETRRMIEDQKKMLVLKPTWNRCLHYAHCYWAKIWSKKVMTLIFFYSESWELAFYNHEKRRQTGAIPMTYLTLKFWTFVIFYKTIPIFKTSVDNMDASFLPPFLHDCKK